MYTETQALMQCCYEEAGAGLANFHTNLLKSKKENSEDLYIGHQKAWLQVVPICFSN